MPLYFLYPRSCRKQDRRWGWSYYRGSCLVVAEDAQRARSVAAAAFTQVTAEPLPGIAAASGSPWFDPELVALRAVPDRIRTDLPLGSVIAPDHACSFARTWHRSGSPGVAGPTRLHLASSG